MKQLAVSGLSVESRLQRILSKALLAHLSLGSEYALPVSVWVSESVTQERRKQGSGFDMLSHKAAGKGWHRWTASEPGVALMGGL